MHLRYTPRFFDIIFLLIVVSMTGTGKLYAQMPVCSGPGSGLIYYLGGNGIYNLDPTQPLSSTNPTLNTISPPSGAIGIAVSNNINSAGPSPTFYVSSSTGYSYYDGTTWVNTGHTSGSGGAVNPGAGGGFIYNLVGSTGEVYKYDGTGNGTLLVTISDFKGGGPFDMIADCHGNFYILRTSTSGNPQYLRKYSPTGTLLQSWTVSGATSSVSGGGMAIIGNRVYYVNGSGYWEGTITGSNINFTMLASSLTPGPSDFSSCALGALGTGGQAKASADTLFFCDTAELRSVYSLSDSADDIVTWSVIKGSVSIQGNGDTIQVGAKSSGSILLTVADTSDCGSIRSDTVFVVLHDVSVDAGTSGTIIGCHEYVDTLQAILKNTKPGYTYNVQWSPASSITGPSDILSPVIRPLVKTTYTITVTMPQSQGGCSWTDEVTMDVKDQVQASFDISDRLLCTDDSTVFNASASVVDPYSDPVSYSWTFGDNSTAIEVVTKHAYTQTGKYVITLVVKDAIGCTDTVSDTLDILHPPFIELGNDTIICNGLKLELPRENTAEHVVSYLWWDSSTTPSKEIKSEGMYVLHVYSECGEYADTFNLGIKDCSVWFPTGFSPNGDSRNDIARVRGKNLSDISDFTLIIVNRFGEVVFKTTDINKGWDGDYKGIPASIGTYYYMIKYNIGEEVSELLKGDITLIR